MLGKIVLGLSALLAAVQAETAPGFPYQVSPRLEVAFGNNTVSPPGERIPRPDTINPPSIRTPIWASGTSGPTQGILLLVDLDVPFNNSRIPLIHWIATNITLAPSSSNTSTSGGALVIPSAAPVPYRQPSPPVGDIPHAYTFVLFAHPANFTFPAAYANLTNNRPNFNTTLFVRDAGLGAPLAGNWFTVQNTTGTPTTTFPPSRPTQTGNATVPSSFPGAGGRVSAGGAAVWAGVVAGVVFVGL